MRPEIGQSPRKDNINGVVRLLFVSLHALPVTDPKLPYAGTKRPTLARQNLPKLPRTKTGRPCVSHEFMYHDYRLSGELVGSCLARVSSSLINEKAFICRRSARGIAIVLLDHWLH